MLMGLAALASAAAAQPTPAVPGGCASPARENIGKAGCYLSVELTIEHPPARLYWHIRQEETEAGAWAAARAYRWSTVVPAHGEWWAYVLSPRAHEPALARHHVAGPFAIAAGKPVVARFMESCFTAGMRTRVHAHSGPEAFYVIDGEQCTETPTHRRRIKAGESYIVKSGLHLQSAPHGRRSLVLILATPGEPWMRLSDAWAGTEYCRD